MKCFFSALFISLLLSTHIQGQTFSERSITSGIEHRHVFIGLIGGGVALFDYDRDNDLDIYLTGGSNPDKLFRNDGNFTFTDISEASGINAIAAYNTVAVSVGDINNDGYKDMFVTTTEAFSNVLFLNNQDGHFDDISSAAGISGNFFSSSATFGDYNLDGFLDIYVANFVEESGFLFDSQNNIVGFDPTCYPNSLYLNNGDNTFDEVSAVAQVNDEGCGLAVAFTDYDNDHDPDIYIANDFGEWHVPNVLLKNRQPLVAFEDVSDQSEAGVAIYGMGIAIGDYDEDGDLDYYSTNMGRNVLLNNQGDGTFRDTTAFAGVENTYVTDLLAVGWGTAFFDYDNDSYLDLIINNGELPTLDFVANDPENPSKLYKNNRDGTFIDVSDQEGFNSPWRGRGLAIGDLDGDGDQDVVAVSIERYNTAFIHTLIYENVGNNGHHWIDFVLEGNKSNRDGYGAHVTVFSDSRKFIREIDGGSSHASASTGPAHFGLGAIDYVDSLLVEWPGGNYQMVYQIPKVDTLFTIKEERAELLLDSSICGGQNTLIIVKDPIRGFEYTLINNATGDLIDGPVISNTDEIQFNTGVIENETSFAILGKDLVQGFVYKLDSVITKNRPYKPDLLYQDDTLTVSNNSKPTWYCNGEELDFQGSKYFPQKTGKYHVTAANEYGCSANSDTLEIIVTSIPPFLLEEVKVYPNPVGNQFTIKLPDKMNLESYEIVSLTGRIIEHKSDFKSGQIEVTLLNKFRGIFILQLIYQGRVKQYLLVRK